jgi:SM-20-related protein
MAQPSSPLPPDGYDPFARITADLAEHGWCAMPGFVSPLLTGQLAMEAMSDWRAGCFRTAGVGRGDELELRPEVRNDQVQWLDPADCSGAQRIYLDQLEQLRLAINRSLYLGLFAFEGHLAVYPPGSYYRRHLDQFRGIGQRTVTAILYLNHQWTEDDGGQLRIYTDPGRPDEYAEILPVGGTLVTFLSARFPHEVLPAQRDRLSLTGWFSTRAAHTA